jgi:hypothetical protein
MASCRTPGLGMLRELADLTGLSAQVTAALADTYRGPWIYDPGAVFADLAAAVADGADCERGVQAGGLAEGGVALARSLPAVLRAVPGLWTYAAPWMKSLLITPLWSFLTVGGGGSAGAGARVMRAPTSISAVPRHHPPDGTRRRLGGISDIRHRHPQRGRIPDRRREWPSANHGQPHGGHRRRTRIVHRLQQRPKVRGAVPRIHQFLVTLTVHTNRSNPGFGQAAHRQPH